MFVQTPNMPRILIANNGLSALKFTMALKDYSNYILIGMVTENDIKCNFEYIQYLHSFVRIPDGPSRMNYGNVQLIVDTAIRLQCDAVWPGWGHASENPLLPRMLKENNIIFIGPHEHAMISLGDKITSTIVAQQCGVPTIPWNGSLWKDVSEIEDITSVKDLCEHIRKIGLPVMLKASAGGGGKGIRSIEQYDEEHIANTYASVIAEVPGLCFVNKKIKSARHIEVQLAGDIYGDVIALSGRECSVQRRHQKIIEEGPPIIVDPDVWIRMQESAVTLAKHVQYHCLGTVEFLYIPETKEFYFLELNPRLQVEHTVTELLYDINLPLIQVELAFGKHLSEFTFEQKKRNVVACRITSEDDTFRPTTGDITCFHYPNYKNTLGYSYLKQGGKIHEFADSQFAHLFAYESDRSASIELMKKMISNTYIRGDISNTLSTLYKILENHEYQENNITTEWLDKKLYNQTFCPSLDYDTQIKLAGVLFHQYISLEITKQRSRLEQGYLDIKRLNKAKEMTFTYMGLSYTFSCVRISKHLMKVCDQELEICGDLIIQNNQGTRFVVNESTIYIGNKKYVLKTGSLKEFRSETSGICVKWFVSDGVLCNKGQKICEIEAMKMSMVILSETDGIIKTCVQPGEKFKRGDLIFCFPSDETKTETKSTVQAYTSVSEKKLSYTEYKQFIQANINDDEIFFIHFKLSEEYNKIDSDLILFRQYFNTTFIPLSTKKCGLLSFSVNNQFILVVNNVKCNGGSFSSQECHVFMDAVVEAINLHVPFVYVAGTSGARISVMEQLLPYLQIAYKPTNEFNYFYMLKQDYVEHFTKDIVVSYLDDEYVIVNGVIGESNPNVENLSSCGAIAGAMANAYKRIPTIAVVSGVTVGIGAYLARLCQRVIQHSNAPLLLTGYKALNAVLNDEIYLSNFEIGGAREVMTKNGICQVLVDTNEELVIQCKHWLEFSFNRANPKRLINSNFVIEDHELKYTPSRHILASLIDRGAVYKEYMTSWAPSVITARTYINNRPFGIIIPDNEITSTILPIDPHNHTSSKPKIYPPNILCSQSSFKIAQFIQDINVEGLPLLILANWRGFSGGTTEMYDSVLKYGSYIVDALNKFKQNIMVYNYGEIRGGVWVVLDSSVNENISFFSSTTAIAGIVEPTAVTTVMNKLVDKVEQHLHVDHERAKQICTEFVSLHDDSRSLLRKGIIRDIVEFKKFKLYI